LLCRPALRRPRRAGIADARCKWGYAMFALSDRKGMGSDPEGDMKLIDHND
jgi:hypothetical protein